ncbi:MAG TPA: hypothetical protein VIQ78_02335 [Terrimesophilobacter sp.]|uniref:hypothetical protein n=1 Tax=Terrimesophilobacter sp. TaxID=2906435 RepID=UPI002F948ABD
MKRFIVPAVAALMVLTGCAGQTPGGSPNPDAPPMMGVPGDGESEAIGLVNLWRVTGAAGEEDPAWLRLDAGEFQLWRSCGMIMGSWRASDTLFLAAPFGGMGDCVSTAMPRVGWLERASGFEVTPDGYDLVDASGSAVASLTIDGAPKPIPTAAEFYTQPPEITDQVRAAFRAAATLPAALTPATASTLAGKWVPVAYSVSTDPHATFAADGTWTGSDGCNGGSGRWVVGAGGEFLATSGPSTLIGCEGAPVPSWVGQATSAGFNDDGWLLLFDAAGTEIGRLER